MPRKLILACLLFSLRIHHAGAQELNAKITVLSNRIVASG